MSETTKCAILLEISSGAAQRLPFTPESLKDDNIVAIMDEIHEVIWLWMGKNTGLVMRRGSMRAARSLKAYGHEMGPSLVGRKLKDVVPLDGLKIETDPDEKQKFDKVLSLFTREHTIKADVLAEFKILAAVEQRTYYGLSKSQRDDLVQAAIAAPSAGDDARHIEEIVGEFRPSVPEKSSTATVIPKIAPKPAVVSPTPKPAVVSPTPKPAVVSPTPKPAVVSPTPKPTVVSPTPKPTVVSPTPKPVVIPPTQKPAMISPPPISKPADISPPPIDLAETIEILDQSAETIDLPEMSTIEIPEPLPQTSAEEDFLIGEIKAAIVITSILSEYSDIFINIKIQEGRKIFSIETQEGPICAYTLDMSKIHFLPGSWEKIDTERKQKIQKLFIERVKKLIGT